jgi:hypothetical protein
VKNFLIAAVVGLGLQGCLVTSGDLQKLADSQAELEAVLEDRTKDQGEIEAALREYGESLDEVVADVEARGGDLVDALSNPNAWSASGLVGAAIWYLRNQTRRKDLAVVKPPNS